MRITINKILYSILGDSQAQHHLRQVLVSLNMHLINKPEIIINYASGKIDNAGISSDETTRRKIKELIDNLVAWTIKLKCEQTM